MNIESFLDCSQKRLARTWTELGNDILPYFVIPMVATSAARPSLSFTSIAIVPTLERTEKIALCFSCQLRKSNLSLSLCNPSSSIHSFLLRERIRVAISLISRPQRKTAPHSPLVARGPPIRPSTAGERTRFRRSRACAPTTHDATDRCASDSRLRCATALPPRSVIVNFVT